MNLNQKNLTNNLFDLEGLNTMLRSALRRKVPMLIKNKNFIVF
jgi:hypothetical protein